MVQETQQAETVHQAHALPQIQLQIILQQMKHANRYIPQNQQIHTHVKPITIEQIEIATTAQVHQNQVHHTTDRQVQVQIQQDQVQLTTGQVHQNQVHHTTDRQVQIQQDQVHHTTDRQVHQNQVHHTTDRQVQIQLQQGQVHQVVVDVNIEI